MKYLLVTSLLSLPIALTGARTINVRDDTRPRAAYTLDNDASGSSVVAMKISLADGTLSNIRKTSTGGVGLLGNTATGAGGPDGLFGQNAIIVSEDYLFTVNAGSNTLSMFSININDPTQLTLIGTPGHTLGDFPMSVAYSSSIKTACVLNGGAANGVTCFSTDHAKGLTLQDTSPRSLCPYLDQTTPPVGPPLTASNIFFNPDSSALFAVIKGNPGTTPPTPSTFFVYPVVNGKVSTTPVISQPSALLVDFGGNFVSNDMLITAEAAFGVALVKVLPNWTIVDEVNTAITGQKAVCWSAYAPRFDTVYALDAGRPLITQIDPQTGAVKGNFSLNAPLTGSFDGAVDRTSLYVLTGTGDVAVVSLLGSNSGKVPSQVQAFDISQGGSTKNFQGMATYPS